MMNQEENLCPEIKEHEQSLFKTNLIDVIIKNLFLH